MTENITFISRRDRRRAARQGGFASNAGTAGRASAAVLAASGLVITTGVAAQAAEAPAEGRESATVQLNTSELNVERASNTANVEVSASSEVELSFDRPAVSSEAGAPAEEPSTAEAEVEQVQATPASQQTEQTQQSEQAQQAPVNEQPAQQSGTETQQQSQEADNGGAEASGETQTSTAGESSEESSAPSGGGHSSVVSAAYSTVGTPHVMGGTTPGQGIDCSGMIQYAYAQAGISVPRTTHGMMGLPSVSSPQAGDIVISNGGGHGGIYVGNGQVISTTSSGGVRVHGLHESWHNVVSYHRPG